jgi:[ribosomal protein S5]-alanine N-acetyltransferase
VIPVPIETARLVLRPFTPGDVGPMSRIFGDPEVMRFITTIGVLDEVQTEIKLGEYARVHEERGFGFLAVVRRSDGRVIGDAGFSLFEPTGDPELGYSLARHAWGHGYASEAAAACIAAAFAHLAAVRVVAVVDDDNAASLRVAERIGMQRADTMDVGGRPHTVLERRRAA